MADYIYLLENRLSKAQQASLHTVREVARIKGLTIFLVGGAVRDLTSGSPVRDLDVVVQGNALKLKKDIEKAGGVLAGENEAGQSLFFRFPGGVRMEIGSTLSVAYPKPGKPVVKPATILDDLRRRDFTANAMALSLNVGSYGLLMDPLNGVADIENRELRLVSNYGFIEDPVRMIRAARLMARLGWQMDERTRSRYETGKQEEYIAAMGDFQRGYETEEIFHEEDPLRVLRRLEAEGWMKNLFPALTAAKANVPELERLRHEQGQLETQGIHPEAATANFPLLTAKLAPKEIAALKTSFVRPGFVAEIEGLEDQAKAFAAEFSGKGAAAPSQAWKLLHSATPESVLWVAHTSKNAGIQAKFRGFFTEWSQAKQKIPYALMQEMRITTEVPQYAELLDKLFFELMDGRLGTVEEMRAFLEPYSPPAPPPPVHLRRARVAKKDAKPARSRKKAAEVAEAAPEGEAVAEDEAGKITPAAEPAKSVPATVKSAGASVKKPAPAAARVNEAAAKAAAPAKKSALPVKAAATKAAVPAKKAAAPAKKAVVAKTPAKKSAPRVTAAPAKKAAAKKVVPAKVAAKKAPVRVAAKKATAVAKPSAKKAVPAKRPPAPLKKGSAPAKKAVAKKVIRKGR